MLTLAAVCIPEGKQVHLQRIVRSLYTKRKRPLKNELKSVDLNSKDKDLFLALTSKMLNAHKDIKIMSITVHKASIDYRNNKFSGDPNVFYNYLTKLLLLKTICQSTYVDFMPDRRSERVNAKWNMGEYLTQMVYEASFEHQIKNKSCSITPMDSSKCIELQFIDFYAGMVWSMYEFQDQKMRKFMSSNRLTNHKLFFPPEEESPATVVECNPDLGEIL